jgi:hypothetical protein
VGKDEAGEAGEKGGWKGKRPRKAAKSRVTELGRMRARALIGPGACLLDLASGCGKAGWRNSWELVHLVRLAQNNGKEESHNLTGTAAITPPTAKRERFLLLCTPVEMHFARANHTRTLVELFFCWPGYRTKEGHGRMLLASQSQMLPLAPRVFSSLIL